MLYLRCDGRGFPLRERLSSPREEDIAYFKKNPHALKEKRGKAKQVKKRNHDDAESGSDSGQAYEGQQPRAEDIRSETTMVSFEVAHNSETVESKRLVARPSCRCVGADQVDFILDTATESSTVKPVDSIQCLWWVSRIIE